MQEICSEGFLFRIKMKNISIIGGGISGCFLSYFLKKDFNVTLYEKSSELGGLSRTHRTIENIPYQNGSHSLKNPENWILELINKFISIQKVEMKFGINPFVDFSTYDFPLHIENLKSISWHWYETIKLELETIREEYTQETLRDFLIRNYGDTIYNVFYSNYYKKMFGVDSEEILFMNEYKSDFTSIQFKKENNYYFPVNSGWNSLFEKLVEGVEIRLNSDVRINDVNSSNQIICTGRPDIFLLDQNLLKYRNVIFDIDSTMYKKNEYDTVLYPNHLPFISMSQLGKLFPNYEKNIVVKEYISDFSEGEEAYIPLTRNNIFNYNTLVEKYPKIIFSGRQGSYKNLSMTDCIKQAAEISAKLKMREK